MPISLGTLNLAWDVWRAGHGPPSGVARRQRARLRELVAFARQHSPFYRQLYRDLPSDVEDLLLLPPVTKRQLMTSFDQVVTDPALTWMGVEAFIRDPSLVGQPLLSRYRAWRSSGVTGEPGIFVQDEAAMAVYRALTFVRGWLPWMRPWRLWTALLRGDRVACVLAVGGHFVSSAMLHYHRQHRPRPFNQIRVFPIQLPLEDLVGQLNAFQPAELVSYPSMLATLAREQRAGRLIIRPSLLGSGSEWLAPDDRALIEAAFGCPVRDNYSASEFTRMVWPCREGRLHVGADWLILEPVDDQYEPVPPGQPSHTTLATNLANRVMPLIRYDVGDRITVYPDPCGCGSPLPTLRLEGRRDDVLLVPTLEGKVRRLLPLAIWGVIHETPGVRRFQVIQTEPTALVLRLEVEPGAVGRLVWETALQRLHEYLAIQSVPHVRVIPSPEPPGPDPVSGKFRHVWSEIPVPPGVG